MSLCEACAALDGVNSVVRPHPDLVSEGFIVRATRTVECFRCRACHTRWSRVVPKTGGPRMCFWTQTRRHAAVHEPHRQGSHTRTPRRDT